MLGFRELKRVVEQLQPRLDGAKVQRVIQPDDDTIVLELYAWNEDTQKAGKEFVTLSANPKFGRLGISTEAPSGLPWPPEFASLLRKHLVKVKVAGIRLVNEDRQAAILLEGKEASYELLLSLMGPRSNLYLLDADGKVMAALRPLSKTRSNLSIGEAYTNPEKRSTPSEIDRFLDTPDNQYAQTVEEHYREREAQRRCDQYAHVLIRCVEKERDFLNRKARKLRADLDEAKNAREQKRLGELLKTVMSQVKDGDESINAYDHETGEDVTIPLDPTLSASDNLEKFFKRYHKGLVGTNMLGQQLEITESYLADLNKIDRDMAELMVDTPNIEALQEFGKRPMMKRLLDKYYPDFGKPKRPPKKKPTKKDVPSRMLPKRFQSSDGLEIWVGKSDAGNDYLTTKLANGNDLFFHVERYPGSHTVLRTAGRKDPPQEAMLEAAELAVHFSKLRNANRVDVHVAPIKQVHKPKGAKPGLVHVGRGKSIALRRDPARLKRTLDARIKD